jgi:signal transduction histidine kinase
MGSALSGSNRGRAATALLAIAVLMWAPQAPGAEQPKQVLILHSFGREFKPWSDYVKVMRSELDRRSPWRLDLQEQILVTPRSEDPAAESAFVRYLDALYAGRPLDLIISIGAPAAKFVQQHRSQLFPRAPMLLTVVEQRRVDYAGLTENDTVVAARNDYAAIFQNILRMLPDTKTVVVMLGASPLERFWLSEVEKESAAFKDRLAFVSYPDLPFEEILKRAATLPPHSAIFWQLMSVDAAGVVHEGDKAFQRLAEVANAPIFSYHEAFHGEGAIGGPMHSVSEVSEQAASVAIRILGGEKAGAIKTEPIGFATPRYDARQLRKWKIAASRLPARSEIEFREVPVWERYPWEIALLALVLLLEGALIATLLNERRRRGSAEVQSQERMAELAHINRYTVAGELTASIAHELNQPLTSILANAEAAEYMIRAPAPDLDEIANILADIRKEDQRAGDVIHGLWTMLKKAPVQLEDLDLNEVGRQTIAFLSGLAVAREVNLTSLMQQKPLPIKGDQIQLQQVIKNLIVNAIDAMSGKLPAERRIRLSTMRERDVAILSISDAGPGIPSDKLKDVFKPFFTTKAEGMGMGLSIAKRIVEAHGGNLSAENRNGGGAVFRISLPLARSANEPLTRDAPQAPL